MCLAEFTFEGYSLTFLGISGYLTLPAEYDGKERGLHVSQGNVCRQGKGKFADPLTIAAQSRDDTFEERLLMRLKDDRDKKKKGGGR